MAPGRFLGYETVEMVHQLCDPFAGVARGGSSGRAAGPSDDALTATL